MDTKYQNTVLTCEHCSSTTVYDPGHPACANPDCGAPLHPTEDIYSDLFGASVSVLSRPLAPVIRWALAPILPLDQMAAHIIDMAKWQYKWDGSKYLPPDFVKMASQTDMIYVIHKASQGTFSDPTYELGVSEMNAAGVQYGTYHYCDVFYSANASAEYYAAQINAIPEEDRWGTDVLPQHWLDVESRRGSGGRDLTNSELTAWIYAFVQKLKSLTDQPFGIYTRKYFWDSYVNRNSWAHLLPLWVARWNLIILEPGEPEDWSDYGEKPVLWQREGDGNGKGSDYFVYSSSIDLSRSPLLTRDQVIDIIGGGAEPPPELEEILERLDAVEGRMDEAEIRLSGHDLELANVWTEIVLIKERLDALEEESPDFITLIAKEKFPLGIAVGHDTKCTGKEPPGKPTIEHPPVGERIIINAGDEVKAHAKYAYSCKDDKNTPTIYAAGREEHYVAVDGYPGKVSFIKKEFVEEK